MPLSTEQIAHREYLKSATWKDIRERVLARDRNKCVKCGNPGSDVHHKTYKRWGNEKTKDLITLCRVCHENLHSARKGAKSKKSIGTRALWNYLRPHQKDLIIKKFNFKDDLDIYREIYLNPNPRVCKFAANLLGFTHWYSQIQRITLKGGKSNVTRIPYKCRNRDKMV